MPYNADLYQHVAPTDNLGTDVLAPKSQNSGSINIHRDYTWTLSNANVRNYIPYVELTEYRQVLSSEISGFFYNLAGKADNVRVGLATAPNTINQTGQVAGANVNRILSNPAGTTVATGVKNTAGILSQAAASVQKDITGTSPEAVAAAQKTDLTGNNPYNRNLVAYTGLYAIEPTGWNYVMPYLTSSNMVNPGNTWGETSGKIKDILSKVTNEGSGDSVSVEDAAKAAAGGPGTLAKLLMSAPALAVAANAGASLPETPKSFNGTGTDSIRVVFYLYNTQNFTDIRRNWEFCYLFTYQNLPNRKGVNLLDPPCLYKVLIPGYKQLPLCWVSDLCIENIGAVKLVNTSTGESVFSTSNTSQNATFQDNPDIKMVPEAYKVSVTFNSVLLNARNIFSYAEDPTQKVTVSVSGQ